MTLSSIGTCVVGNQRRTGHLQDGDNALELIPLLIALLIELRAYPRSRTETVARPCVVLLLAPAKDAADLDRLEEGLEFKSAPLPEEPPLAELPR